MSVDVTISLQNLERVREALNRLSGKQAKEAPAAAFRAVLESAAVIVPAGAAAGGAAVDADPEFAAGDGAADRAALDRRAREYARTKGVSYAEAVQHCIANP